MKKGDSVTWKYGKGHGHGTIQAISPDRITKTIKGKKIVRNGTAENPAVEILDHNGVTVLKLESELTAAG